MRSASLATAAAILLSGSTLAFRDSSPLLIWSSSPNPHIQDAAEAITSGVIAAEDVYGIIPSLGCDWETLAIVHVDELHQSHLPSFRLPPSADLHIPYLIKPARTSLDAAVDEWAKICGAEVVTSLDDVEEGRTIVRLDASREDDLAYLTSRLAASHLLLLTGSRTPFPSSEKRKERPFPSSATTTPATARPGPTGGNGGVNTTLPTGGPLLDRVQILTTPVITAVLISFGLFIPIIMFGVSALAGIQVPPRMLEIGKGLTVGKERKDQ